MRSDEMDGESFGCGMFVGIIIVIIFVLLILSNYEEKIVSTKPLIPQTQLTTDGKTVDTLYIYKNEKNENN